MTLTEEEAKTKRCQESYGQPIYNSQSMQTTDNMVAFAMGAAHGAGYVAFGSPSHCIGSACMAWRWSRPDGMTDKGYCGKAGQP